MLRPRLFQPVPVGAYQKTIGSVTIAADEISLGKNGLQWKWSSFSVGSVGSDRAGFVRCPRTYGWLTMVSKCVPE
jgi:hypothetical protein